MFCERKNSEGGKAAIFLKKKQAQILFLIEKENPQSNNMKIKLEKREKSKNKQNTKTRKLITIASITFSTVLFSLSNLRFANITVATNEQCAFYF